MERETAATLGADRSGRTVAVAGMMLGLFLLLVTLLAGVFVWQGREDARAVLEARATGAAYTASMHVRWVIEANLQALGRVAEAMTRRPDLLAGADTVRDLGDAVAGLPGAVHLWVFNERGEPVLSSQRSIAPVNIGDRAYFHELQSGSEWQIGALLVARNTGRKVFPVGRRIEREGKFAGAVITYVPADLLADFWRSMDLGPGSTVGLLREDGWLVARFPVPDQPMNLSGYTLFTDHLPQASDGVYVADRSPADGVARLVAYHRVEGLPLVTAVGVPVSAVTDELWPRFGVLLAVAGPITLALIALALWVVRLLRQDEDGRRALATALEQNRLLLREIHHRVKNNLQTVAALVQLQPGPPEPKQELMRRIAAMTAVHEHIYGSDQYDRVDLADYVRRLLTGVSDGYGPGVRLECELAPVSVDTDLALPLGLLVNEVVSNAFKHAFPDSRAGLIRVTLSDTGAGRAVLDVHDDGVGYRPERQNGMGTRLIHGLSRQIGGQYEYRVDGGTRFTLTFPLKPADALVTA